jgi:predicted NBD/HSP70 family sugar kinase
MNKAIAGVDIGGTKTAVALESSNGEFIVRQLPTRDDGFETIERISKAIEATLEKNRAKLISVAAASIGGIMLSGRFITVSRREGELGHTIVDSNGFSCNCAFRVSAKKLCGLKITIQTGAIF